MVQGWHQETMLHSGGHGVLVLRRRNDHRALLAGSLVG